MRAPFSSQLLALLALLLPVFAGAKPRAEAALEPADIELGATAEFSVQVAGANQPGPTPPIAVEGLEIRALPPSREYSVGFINGNFSRTSIIVYHYEVSAKRAGSFTIPGLNLPIDGEMIQTRPVAFNVTKPGDPAGGIDTRARGEIFLPKKTAWVGEQLPVQLRLMADARIHWRFETLPTFSGEGFTHTKIFDPRRTEVQQDGRTWNLGWFQTWISPTRAGKLEIGPAELTWLAQIPRAQRARPATPFADIFPEGIFGDMASGYGATQRLHLRLEPVELEVKPLPAQGQPKSFAGAVGRFEFQAHGAPNRVKMGDPVTVKLTVTGQGNFDRVTAPVLSDTNGWRTYPATETSEPVDEEAGPRTSRTFEVAVIPEAKQTAMPVFEFAYFDPEAARYVTLHSESAPLTVEGEAPAPPTAPPAITRGEAAEEPAAATDILGLRYDVGTPRSMRPLYRERGFLLAQLVPLAALLLWLAGQRRRPDGRARQAAGWRRQQARLTAQLRRERDRQAFYDTAARVVQLGTALRTGLNPEAIDAATARRHAPAEVPVEEIFDERAAALFAGGGPSSGALASSDRERILAALARMGSVLLLLSLLLPAGAEEAPALYEQGKYAEAQASFEAQLSHGPVTANLFYNLGNAEYRLHEPGRAALQYERALALEPGHPEARANLALLRSQTGAQALTPAAADLMVPPWPGEVFSIAGAVCAWAAVFAAIALLPRRRRERALLWAVLVLGVGGAAWSGLVLWRQAAQGRVAIVLPATTEARTEPADRSARVAPLTAGSEVRVLGERGAWIYCELPGALRGWLPATALETLRGCLGL